MIENGRDGMKEDVRLDVDSKYGSDLAKSRWDRAQMWRNRAGVGHSPWHSLIRTERAGVWGEAEEQETKEEWSKAMW